MHLCDMRPMGGRQHNQRAEILHGQANKSLMWVLLLLAASCLVLPLKQSLPQYDACFEMMP
jgi:hypothetical protein